MRSKGGKGGNGGLAALAMAHAQGGCMRMPQHSQYAPSMAALVAAADAALSPAFERRMEKGHELLAIGRAQHAIVLYTEALAIASSDDRAAAVALCNRSLAQFKAGNFRKAKEDGEASLARDSTYLPAQACIDDATQALSPGGDGGGDGGVAAHANDYKALFTTRDELRRAARDTVACPSCRALLVSQLNDTSCALFCP